MKSQSLIIHVFMSSRLHNSISPIPDAAVTTQFKFPANHVAFYLLLRCSAIPFDLFRSRSNERFREFEFVFEIH